MLKVILLTFRDQTWVRNVPIIYFQGPFVNIDKFMQHMNKLYLPDGKF